MTDFNDQKGCGNIPGKSLEGRDNKFQHLEAHVPHLDRTGDVQGTLRKHPCKLRDENSNPCQ